MMNHQADLDTVVSETLTYVRRLVHDGVEPVAALDGLAALEKHHPETPMDLVWVQEPYDGSVHYDALIHVAGEGTVSLSFAADGDLPWPLRGVQRWQDRNLARVNGGVVTVDQAIAQLDFIWDEVPLVRRLVNTCLIQETLKREPITVDEADLQEAMDSFRRARGLFTAEDTHQWLADKALSAEKLEQLLVDQATLRKLRARVAEGRVEDYFVAHRDELAEVGLLRLDFADEGRARAALDELRRGETFVALAERALAEAVSRGEQAPVLESLVLRRREAATFELPIAVAPGDLVGPLPSKRGAALVQALAVQPACLDKRTRQAVEQVLFEDWLADRRKAARIEWYWGNASQVVGV
jgi:putative peptide maturation system protein